MIGRFLLTALTLAYPFIVLIGLKCWGLTAVAGIVVLICALNYFIKPSRLSIILFFLSLVLVSASLILKIALPLKLYPVAVNITLFAFFSLSLLSDQSAIERIARLKDPNLAPEGVRYTRKLTILWCIFFIINGLIATWSAIYASDEIWALYNGLIAYFLIGIFIVGEIIVRRHIIKSR